VCVYVNVCVCVRERKTEREGERERDDFEKEKKHEFQVEGKKKNIFFQFLHSFFAHMFYNSITLHYSQNATPIH
jgi:hypothetical protein